MFDEEDYEELYANVETILECNVKTYRSAWEAYAEGNPYTAEQWRLFFEKAVLPDWEKDPESKKEAIKRRVHQRHDEEKQESEVEDLERPEPSTPKRESGKQKPVPAGSTTSDDDLFDSYVEKFLRERHGNRAQEAYIFWARTKDDEKKTSLWNQYSHLNTGMLVIVSLVLPRSNYHQINYTRNYSPNGVRYPMMTRLPTLLWKRPTSGEQRSRDKHHLPLRYRRRPTTSQRHTAKS